MKHLSPEIGQLTHLEALDVSATTLTTFPATLATLPRLKKLVINQAQAQALDSPHTTLNLSPQVSLSLCEDDSWMDHPHGMRNEREEPTGCAMRYCSIYRHHNPISLHCHPIKKLPLNDLEIMGTIKRNTTRFSNWRSSQRYHRNPRRFFL